MLDSESPLPLYFQLQEILRKKILTGEYTQGDLIPSEKELEKQYSVSRITVRNAINGLVLEDLLIKKQGKGTTVAYPRMQEEENTSLQSFTEKMENKGVHTSTKVFDVAKMPVPERIAEHLDTEPGNIIIYAKRLRLVDGEPMALFENYISSETGVTENDDFSGSVFNLFEKKYGIKISSSEKVIEAGTARKEDADLLQISEGDPVLIITYTTYSSDNKRIELAEGIYRADRYKFMVRLKR